MNFSKKQYLWTLGLIAGLFAFRVCAQLIALIIPNPVFLPGYEQWHSGLLPYPALLAAQIFILAIFTRTFFAIYHDTIRPSAQTGRLLLLIGLTYVALTILRISLGLTLLDYSRFFSNNLTSGFHLLLASSFFLMAHFHFHNKGVKS